MIDELHHKRCSAASIGLVCPYVTTCMQHNLFPKNITISSTMIDIERTRQNYFNSILVIRYSLTVSELLLCVLIVAQCSPSSSSAAPPPSSHYSESV